LVSADVRARPVAQRAAFEAQISTKVLRQDSSRSSVAARLAPKKYADHISHDVKGTRAQLPAGDPYHRGWSAARRVCSTACIRRRRWRPTRRQRRYCASALSRNFAVEGGHNASKRDELAPLRSIVSSRQRAVNRFANSRVVMSARRTPPSGTTCWRGQFNIRWVVLMEVRPLRWVLEGLREHMSDETNATGERRRRWRLGSVARASSGRPERPP
jgi:hypothetical protein